MTGTLLGLVLVVACQSTDEDVDGDGFAASLDCNDDDQTVNPAAVEVCNGVDDDCDGEADDRLMATWYVDADRDGAGDPGSELQACDRPPNGVSTAGDCDDGDPDIRPNAPERCNELDDDCDGEVDENLAVSWYEDNDQDGVGGALVSGCEVPEGAAGFGGDCDDADPTVSPQEAELCDGIDQDCDLLIDEGVGTPYYPDVDGDGYGDLAAISTNACEGAAPAGLVLDHSDCDDTRDDVFAGAPEVCDGVDDDCDGKVDEGVALRYWVDADGDGYGDPDPATMIFGCTLTAGYATNDYDCDDTEPLAHFEAAEVCDAVDNDCDGSVDEGVSVTWYADADADGWGDEAAPVVGCTPPASGVVFTGQDCDDGRDDVHPGLSEVCDLADQDCDGLVDEGVNVSWWADADGDGFGDPKGLTYGCVVPPDGSLDPTDCDDADGSAFPGGTEVCDGKDQDCNRIVDDDVATLYYYDGDADGAGTLDAPFVRDCSTPSGYAEAAGDCDDADPAVGSACAPVLTAEWTTYGGDEGRTGFVPGYVTGGALTAGWAFTDPGRTALPPAIVGGAVVVTTNGATDAVTALSLVDGSQLWQYALQAGANPTGPSVADGLVVVARTDLAGSSTVALDEGTGVQTWRSAQSATSYRYRAPLVASGRVFDGGGTSVGLYALSETSGSQSWFVGLSAYDDWTPVAYSTGVFVQAGDHLRGYAQSNGNLVVDVPLGSLPVGTAMGTVPALVDDVALAVAGDDLVLVDLTTSTVRWTLTGGFSGSPTIAHGLGYAIRDGDVAQFDLADGYYVQSFVGDGALTGKPVVTDDAVIASSASGTWVWQLWDAVEVDQVGQGGDLAVGDGAVLLTAGETVQTYTW